MDVSPPGQSNHTDFVKEVSNSQNRNRGETIKVLQEAFDILTSSKNNKEARKEYEKIRQQTITEYCLIRGKNKEELASLYKETTEARNLTQFTKEINDPKTKFATLKSEDKIFLFNNFNKIGGNITNVDIVKEALDYKGSEKNSLNYNMYTVLKTELKSDFSIIQAVLNDKDFKGYISNNNQDITKLIPESFFQNIQNTQKFLEAITPIEGYKVADIIPRVIEISDETNSDWDGIETKKKLYISIMSRLNGDGISQVLYDMSDEVFEEYIKTERETIEKKLQKGAADIIINNRGANGKKFQNIIKKIDDDEDIIPGEIPFIETQMIKSGGVKKHLPQLKKLLEKNPYYFTDLPSIQGEKELALVVAQKLKTGIFEYLSSDLKQDIEVLTIIFATQEDFDRGVELTYIEQINDENTKKQLLQYLKKKGITIGIHNTYSLRSAEKGFEQSLGRDLQKIEQEGERRELSQIAESTTDNGAMTFTQTADGSYTIFVRGESIPGLTKEEYQGLGNKEMRENLLHFYTVLKDCGLEQVWRQRENIFKAIGNKKGIAFDTKDGDYLGKNEVKIFLQSMIKSIASQFKEQGELTEALNTESEQEIISFIKNYNGENNLTGSAKDKLGRTKITELFFDTYFPQNKDRVFQQSNFEDAFAK